MCVGDSDFKEDSETLTLGMVSPAKPGPRQCLERLWCIQRTAGTTKAKSPLRRGGTLSIAIIPTFSEEIELNKTKL